MLVAVAGTRPEVIKLTPLLAKLSEKGIEHEFWVIYQHRELLDAILDELHILPDLYVEVDRSDPSLADFMGQALPRLCLLLKTRYVRGVLIQGDTASALCAAQAAFLEKIPVIHIEAGIRSLDLLSPFPEEAFRRWIDEISMLKFCPTTHCSNMLYFEGLLSGPNGLSNSFVTGNTSIDAVNMILGDQDIDVLPSKVQQVCIDLHRRESWDVIPKIITRLAAEASSMPNVDFIVTQHPALSLDKITTPSNFHIEPPRSYASMLKLISSSILCITDSGGVQEEAAYLGTPTLIARKVTDRIESVREGLTKVVGTEPDTISSAMVRLLTEKGRKQLNQMTRRSTVFGNGEASARIVGYLQQWFPE